MTTAKRKPPAKRAATARKRAAVKRKDEPTRHEHSAGFGVTRKFPADKAPKGDA